MPEAPTLSWRRLRRVTLARQLLLERVAIDLPSALERIAGLQSQYAPTMYVGLWSRLDGFRRDDLTSALERREVVQATMMRGTIHLVSARDYWPMIVAIREPMRAWWLRNDGKRFDGADIPAAVERVRAALTSDGSIPVKDLERIAGPKLFPAVGQFLDLVRAPPSGTWEHRRADRYALAEAWIGPPPPMSVADARDLLVRRYLGGFGPSTAKEVATWCGVRVGDIAPTLERLSTATLLAEDGTRLHDLPGQALPDEDAPAPVRFLSNWEAVLLVHKRRTGILREDDRSRIFHNRAPQSFATFLVDGVVAGTWRIDGGRVEVMPFRPLGKLATRQVAEEGERLAVSTRDVPAAASPRAGPV